MEDTPDSVKQLSNLQKILLLSVGAVIATAIGISCLTDSHGLLATLLVFAVWGGCLTGLIAATMIAFRVRGVGFGIVIPILCLIPVANLLGLLIANGAASKRLKQAGYRVGFLGASPPR